MKIFLICLIMILNQAEHLDKRKAEGQSGFHVEIRNIEKPDSIRHVFIDMNSITDLPVDTISSHESDGKPDREWIGFNLCLIIEKKLNLSCHRIKKISISAPDGYMSVISGELLSALKTGMCAYRIKGEKTWPGNYGYMRLIFPQLRGMYWVNAPNKMIIEIGKDQPSEEQYEFYFLESENIRDIIKSDLKRNSYIAIEDILVNLNATQQPFHILTRDSLYREYSASSINRHLLLHQEPEGSWKLTGVAVPLGLRTRSIFLILTRNKLLFLKPLSDHEQNILHVKYFRNILERVPVSPGFSLQIQLRDGRRVSAGSRNVPPKDFPDLYRIIEQQRKKYNDVDCILMNLGSN